MPAVVRGGRRQGTGQAPRRGGGSGGRSRGASPGGPGKLAAIGRIDMSPRTAAIALGAGALLLLGVMATGSRAERIRDSVSRKFDQTTVAMGLKINNVHIAGASAEAEPAIQRALNLTAGEPIIGLDLAALRDQVQTVGWVKEARVVRLLPDTIMVEVKEHDRLAVWQVDGQIKVIDSLGQVIDGADARLYPALPLVVGRGADGAAAEILPLLAQRPRLMSRLDALVRVDERRWNLRLKDGSLIQLPATEQEAALIRLDAIDQRQRLLDMGFGRVDLRTADEVAVRLNDNG